MQGEAMPDYETQLEALHQQMADLEKKITTLKQSWGAAAVTDYTLSGPGGPVKLSQAFGDHEYMVLIHNMGHQCPYCTLWADGFRSIWEFVEKGVPGGETRAAFVLVSPDAPEKQAEVAGKRGWKFRMLSQKGTTLAKDLGYEKDGHLLPGVSILKREDGKIRRVARDFFGPGDKYNAVFSFFQLFPGSPIA
jgi:peroxiredoxin